MKFKDLLLIDFLTGLATTGKHFPRKKFTVQYPEKRLAPSPRFRGMFRLDTTNCLACSMCANSCPIKIIHMETHDETAPDGKRKRIIDRFDIDLKRCMFCGLCVEKCPQGHAMLAMDTGEYELATYERNMTLYLRKEQLLKNAENYWKKRGEPMPQPKSKEAAKEKADA